MEGFGKQQKIVDKPAAADGCLVVDVSNLAYRSAYAYSLNTSSGQRSGHVYGSVKLLLSTMKNSIGPGNWCIVFCYDGKNAKAVRQKTLPEYKANREDGRFNPLPEVSKVLHYIPGIHIEAEGFEGDDAIAWVTKFIHGRFRSKKQLVVLTGDKDLWALTKMEEVKVLSPNLKRFVTPDDIMKNYLVEDPEKIYLAKALTGDTSDGIKGVPRIQKAKLAYYMNMEGVNTPEDMYDKMESMNHEGLTPRAQGKLSEFKDKVISNYQVVIPRTEGFTKDHVFRVESTSSNREALERSLLKYECKNLVKDIGPLYGEPEYVKVKE